MRVVSVLRHASTFDSLRFDSCDVRPETGRMADEVFSSAMYGTTLASTGV